MIVPDDFAEEVLRIARGGGTRINLHLIARRSGISRRTIFYMVHQRRSRPDTIAKVREFIQRSGQTQQLARQNPTHVEIRLTPERRDGILHS